MGKDYLAAILEAPDDLEHQRIARDFVESSVTRGKGGKFAKKGSSYKADALDAKKAKLIGQRERIIDRQTQKMNAEAKRLYGPDIIGTPLDKFLERYPAGPKRKAKRAEIMKLINRQVDEFYKAIAPLDKQLDQLEKQAKHDDLGEYMAAEVADFGDGVWSGVKGMKWGVRKKKDTTDHLANATASSAKPHGNIQDHVESSAARYDRLKAQAKSGDAKSMTDQDLKFFNARTEALAKINKMNESKPGWLGETTKKVVQTAAQRAMQDIANGVTDKYVSGPVLEKIAPASGKKKKKK